MAPLPGEKRESIVQHYEFKVWLFTCLQGWDCITPDHNNSTTPDYEHVRATYTVQTGASVTHRKIKWSLKIIWYFNFFNLYLSLIQCVNSYNVQPNLTSHPWEAVGSQHAAPMEQCWVQYLLDTLTWRPRGLGIEPPTFWSMEWLLYHQSFFMHIVILSFSF